jgi:hypothetical protein
MGQRKTRYLLALMDGPTGNSHDADWFTQSLAAALIVGVGGGLLLMLLGIAIATNWRGWAEHYSYWTGLFLPARRPDFDERQVRQNRVIFGVFAVFGAMLFVSGVIASFR